MVHASVAIAPSIRSPAAGRWRFLLGVVVGLAAWGLVEGLERSPTGADAGTAFHAASSPSVPLPDGPASKLVPHLRLGTFNIHGGRGPDGRLDLARTASRLHALDFVGLNEVHGDWLGQTSQAAELGDLLRLNWLFAPTESRFWHEHFGNAALSRIDIRAWQRIPLPRTGAKACRNMLLVETALGQPPLRIVVTHIDRTEPARTEQLRTVSAFFLSLAEPVVLMGDLNTTADDPLLRQLLATAGVNDALAPLEAPTPRIDWILTRGLRSLDRGSYPAEASDHPNYWIECEGVATTAPDGRSPTPSKP